MGDETKEVRKCCHGTPTTDYCHPCEKIVLAARSRRHRGRVSPLERGELAE
jgi:hypothetical protein